MSDTPITKGMMERAAQHVFSKPPMTGENTVIAFINFITDEVISIERRLIAAEAENAALRKDAERYRWLRDAYYDTPIGGYEWSGMNGAQRRIFLGASELDEAIDAARTE